MDRATPFTRFQRMLLGTDGTVTHILEAYSDEPIEVVKLLQERDSSGPGDTELELAPGEEVLRRRVLLRGAHSRRTLLYAEAVVALGRVQAAFLDGLVTTDMPIGILLAQARTETFREILNVGREPAGDRGEHFGLDADSELISRTYLIVRESRPMILITEKFPSDSFRDVPA
jgi:chorismate-pyruvate lyase